MTTFTIVITDDLKRTQSFQTLHGTYHPTIIGDNIVPISAVLMPCVANVAF
jgi:hypothetical protein